MSKITLIAMPVMETDRPSISLAQLESAVLRDPRLAGRVTVDVLHLNHDFAAWLDDAAAGADGAPGLHRLLLDNQHTGLPDWLFRQAAFPWLPDNAIEYLRRYYPGRSKETQELKDRLLAKRGALEPFLNGLIDRYAIDRARIVGFTSMFTQNVATFALARLLKQRRAEICVVMGGANCETPMGEELVKNVAAVDYVFSGPGLKSFPEFVARQLDGAVEECAAVRGVFSKQRPQKEGHDRLGDELPIEVDVPLDYTAFFASFDRAFPNAEQRGERPMVLFETSRGCWWGARAHCTFCGLNGATMEYRAMPAANAVALLNDLFARYGSRSSTFFCVDNIMPKNWVKDVLPLLHTPDGAKIFYEVKANLSEEDLRVMAGAGVTRIQPGIEALATATLKRMMKGTTAFVNLQLLKNCLRFDIEPVWNLLVGFPGEGEDVYAKYFADLPRVVHLPPPQGVAAVRIDRFSPYFMKADEYGLKLRRFDFYPLIYPFEEESLARMAYFFTDVNYEAPYIKTLAQWIGRLRARIQEWRSRWQAGPAMPRLAVERAGSGFEVVDTRGADERRVPLADGAAALLAHLATPRRQWELKTFGEERGLDVARELAFLDAHGLVWQEGDTVLSLVTEHAAGAETPVRAAATVAAR